MPLGDIKPKDELFLTTAYGRPPFFVLTSRLKQKLICFTSWHQLVPAVDSLGLLHFSEKETTLFLSKSKNVKLSFNSSHLNTHTQNWSGENVHLSVYKISFGKQSTGKGGKVTSRSRQSWMDGEEKWYRASRTKYKPLHPHPQIKLDKASFLKVSPNSRMALKNQGHFSAILHTRALRKHE